MLEVTGGAMATLTPANANVDWPATYLASQLCQANATKAEALIEQVSVVCCGAGDLFYAAETCVVAAAALWANLRSGGTACTSCTAVRPLHVL
jgi:hypothetical protein